MAEQLLTIDCDRLELSILLHFNPLLPVLHDSVGGSTGQSTNHKQRLEVRRARVQASACTGQTWWTHKAPTPAPIPPPPCAAPEGSPNLRVVMRRPCTKVVDVDTERKAPAPGLKEKDEEEKSGMGGKVVSQGPMLSATITQRQGPQ